MMGMASIQSTLFEDPFFVYLALGLTEAIIVVMWRTGGRSGRWVATRLAVVMALAGATFAVERLVVTDPEQIQNALQDIAESVPAGRIDHAMDYIDESYAGWGAVKSNSAVRKMLAAAAKKAVQTYNVQKISLLGKPRVEVNDKFAECKVTIIITYSPEGEPLQHAMSWKLDWIKRPEGWRIEQAKKTTLDLLP